MHRLSIPALSPISSSASSSSSSSSSSEKKFHNYHAEKETIYIIEKDKILGKGGQASMVVEAHEKNNDNHRAAVKIYEINNDSDHASRKALENDINIECGNLLAMKELFGLVKEENIFYIFMKFHPGQNLLRFLYKISADENKLESDDGYYVAKSEVSFSDQLNLTLNIIQAIIIAHERNIIHRDIATSNFVFEKSGNEHSKLICKLALIDWGSARQVNLETKEFIDPTRHFQAHFGYYPPELIHLEPHEKPRFNFKTDYWQLGIVLGEIWSTRNFQQALYDLKKELPIASSAPIDHIKECLSDIFFPERDDYLLKKEIFNQKEKEILEIILPIIQKLCQNNPDDRFTLEELSEIQNEIKKLRKNYLAPNRKGSNAPAIPRLKLENLSSPVLSPLSPRKETVIYGAPISLTPLSPPKGFLSNPHFLGSLESPRTLFNSPRNPLTRNQEKEEKKEKKKGKGKEEEKKKMKKRS